MEELQKKRQSLLMRTQSPPPKIARHADSAGLGLINWGHVWRMENDGSIKREGSPPTGLRLGLELGPGSGHRLSFPRFSSGFTQLQLQELEQQALIYKYMEAGLPVPSHLVFPIWKSFAGSFGGVSGGIYQRYPSFLGCGTVYYGLKSGMDQEPGRCRRTDGKKWRCSKDVVPDKKYCERHMHRGRHRSRKHVEASQPSASSTINTSTTATTNRDVLNSNTNLSISLQASTSSSNASPRNVLHGGGAQ